MERERMRLRLKVKECVYVGEREREREGREVTKKTITVTLNKCTQGYMAYSKLERI